MLIYLHCQTIQNVDIHEVCGACGCILNWFGNKEWYNKQTEQVKKEFNKDDYYTEEYGNKLIDRLNKACKTNYTFSDFVERGTK
jgi:ribonuclease HIII